MGFYARGNLTLDVNGSVGFEDLTTSQTSLGTSAGVLFTKPGTFLDPANYAYAYTPVIYGQQPPGGLVNDQSLDTDVTTFGVLRTVYVVDPLSTGAGFWEDAYGQHPDVALNHPVRWQVKTATSDPGDGTCLAFNPGSSDLDCVSLGTKLPPTGIWDDEFHAMRGLFITPATSPGQGSQLQVAHAGDQLMLQARVYNYSLKAMDPGTTVHVRFYGQEWDQSTNSAIGNSFLIGEAKLGPIPPFNTDTPDPNWLLASLPAPFDTTPYADKTLTFWVIVWMQDTNGALVKELDNHGLMTGPCPGVTPPAPGAVDQHPGRRVARGVLQQQRRLLQVRVPDLAGTHHGRPRRARRGGCGDSRRGLGRPSPWAWSGCRVTRSAPASRCRWGPSSTPGRPRCRAGRRCSSTTATRRRAARSSMWSAWGTCGPTTPMTCTCRSARTSAARTGSS